MALIRSLMATGFAAPAAQQVVDDVLLAGVATGTTQADALELSNGSNVIATTASGTGVKLWRNAQIGDTQCVFNDGANDLAVYPPTGCTINGAAADASVIISSGQWAKFRKVSATAWKCSYDSGLFLQSGSGASATTVQTELRRWIRPEHYGAAADGVTNDRTAISSADTVATSSGTILFQSGKTYLCSTSLTIAATCYFEPGAQISIASGQTITFSGRVISLGGTPTAGSGTTTYSHDGNVFFNSAAGSGGFGFGITVPSGTDHFFSIERNVNTSTGILIKNQNTGSSTDAFIHLWGGVEGVSGSDIRIGVQSAAAGGEVNIVGKCNSLATNTNAALNIINASNAQVTIYANNKKQFAVLPTSNTVNYGTIKGGAASSSPIWSVAGTDSNLSFIVDAIGTGGFIARTDAGAVTAFEVVRVASANRYIRVTPSNGGNPILSTTAGSLNISSALQLTSLGAFAASDKYLIVDASGNVHVSALGPAS